jgi:formylglycine-generating enzyme required for sulfatase activity
MNWAEMRAYCRYLGKQLPTSEQWERSLRGGLTLPDGHPNPMPRRSLPWGAPRQDVPAKLDGIGDDGAAAVGTYPDDRSPEGILDLAGNVMEWTTNTAESAEFRYVRGGGWAESNPDNMLEYIGAPNQRSASTRAFNLGFRCALSKPDSR